MKSLLLVLLMATADAAVGLNPEAPIGGTFAINLKGEPSSLHPIMASDGYSDRALAYVMDTLAQRDPVTGEFAPRLAEKWEASKDQKVYTFFLRANAFFHDGKPVTAEDVKFSYDAIFEPSYRALHLQPYFEGIEKVEVVNLTTVKFYLKDTYFQNFIAVASMMILPKHVYGDAEKSRKITRTAIGAGPYSLEKFEKGDRLVLKRNDKWYGFSTKEWKGAYNFSTVILRFAREQAASLALLKKGELDFDELTAEEYVKKTEGTPWGETIFKFKVENKAPKTYAFIGWNFRRELFQNKNVRWALAHLMNRDEMIQKFRYGLSVPATGPTYLQSVYSSPKVKPINYDPQKAAELLGKAGWKDSDQDGLLDKVINGKKTPFRFTMIYSNKDTEKYWDLYKTDLKKAGIEMDLKYLEWATFRRTLDEGSFDAVTMAWGTTVDWDPKQVWHSSSAVSGGYNFIAYKNPEVDKLIDVARLEPNQARRIQKLRRIYELIAADAPYAFLFNDKFVFYANSAKVEKPGDTFPYGNGNADNGVGYDFWWSRKR